MGQAAAAAAAQQVPAAKWVAPAVSQVLDSGGNILLEEIGGTRDWSRSREDGKGKIGHGWGHGVLRHRPFKSKCRSRYLNAIIRCA